MKLKHCFKESCTFLNKVKQMENAKLKLKNVLLTKDQAELIFNFRLKKSEKQISEGRA